MKAIGRNLIIQKTKEGTTKTKGGLLLAETHRDDIRYIEANVKSIGEETFSFKAKEEQYSSAAIDVSNRLVSILTNKGDPGPPTLNRTNDSSNFKSAKVTEERRSKYVAIIIILLVIAFVVPMVQFFYYVKDE